MRHHFRPLEEYAAPSMSTVGGLYVFLLYILFYSSQIYNLLYNGAISEYVVRKHLCGAIIQ
jgi:hypothetical protein